MGAGANKHNVHLLASCLQHICRHASAVAFPRYRVLHNAYCAPACSLRRSFLLVSSLASSLSSRAHARARARWRCFLLHYRLVAKAKVVAGSVRPNNAFFARLSTDQVAIKRIASRCDVSLHECLDVPCLCLGYRDTPGT